MSQFALWDGCGSSVEGTYTPFKDIEEIRALASKFADKQEVHGIYRYSYHERKAYPRGRTILHAAAAVGDILLLEQLIESAGCKVDCLDSPIVSETPLFAAVCHGRVKAVKWLLDHGANPNFKSSLGYDSMLHMAALDGYINVLELLLQPKYKQDVNALSGRKRTILDEILGAFDFDTNASRVEVAKLLIKHGGKISDDKAIWRHHPGTEELVQVRYRKLVCVGPMIGI